MMISSVKVYVLCAGMLLGAIFPAVAGPVFSNPNFVPGSAVPANGYYNYTTNVDGWQGSSGNTAYTAQNSTYLWDNGAVSVSSILALNGHTSGISQMVSGFIVGQSYGVSALANARAYNQPTQLTLTVNDGQNATIIGTSTLNAVDPIGIFVTMFTPFQSSTFVATSTNLLFNFYNSQNADSSVLLTGASISSVPSPVPEPLSLSLLGSAFLVTIGLRRRRS